MTGASIFVLRYRSPGLHRPFRVPFYPLTPILFCLTSAYLLYASINYTGQGALYGVAELALGLPLIIWRRMVEPRAALAPMAYPGRSTEPISNPSREKR